MTSILRKLITVVTSQVNSSSTNGYILPNIDGVFNVLFPGFASTHNYIGYIFLGCEEDQLSGMIRAASTSRW